MTDPKLRSDTLDDLLTLIIDYRGKTPKKLDSDWQAAGIPAISAKNVKHGRIVNPDAIKYVSDELYAKWMKEELEAGDILLTSEAPLGQAFYLKEKKKWVLSQRLYALRANTDKILPRYLAYYLESDFGQSELKSRATGATAQGIRQSLLREVSVTYPALHLQRKIASILSAYDDLIENNTRRIAILEEMAQAIYREWFVNFRFPGHENVKLVDSPIGKIPQAWGVAKLASIADVNAKSIKKGNAPQSIKYIDIASVSTGKIEEIRPMSFSDAPSRARRVVRHGDVIWSTVRPVRRSYSVIIDPLPDTIASTGFAVLTATNVPFSYLYYATTTDEFATYLVNHATGAAYPAVNASDFENADVLLPEEGVLNQFNDVVADMLVFGQRLLTKNNNLRNTRDLLLPKLISGQLDVEDLDIDTGPPAEVLEEAA